MVPRGGGWRVLPRVGSGPTELLALIGERVGGQRPVIVAAEYLRTVEQLCLVGQLPRLRRRRLPIDLGGDVLAGRLGLVASEPVGEGVARLEARGVYGSRGGLPWPRVVVPAHGAGAAPRDQKKG